jgi:hypothetical protein
MNQDKRAGWQMPVWLVDWEMEREPEGWISRALRWGWVEEALDWSVELLRRVGPIHRVNWVKLMGTGDAAGAVTPAKGGCDDPPV